MRLSQVPVFLISCEALSEARTGCLATLIFVVFQRRLTQNVDKRSSKSQSILLQIKSSQTRLCFRSTPADPNAFPVCSKVLSLDDFRFKSVFYAFKYAFVRRSSIQMRFLCAQTCSRSTAVDQNAYSICLRVGGESINPSCRLQLPLTNSYLSWFSEVR